MTPYGNGTLQWVRCVDWKRCDAVKDGGSNEGVWQKDERNESVVGAMCLEVEFALFPIEPIHHTLWLAMVLSQAFCPLLIRAVD
jgi:hypothetical protein